MHTFLTDPSSLGQYGDDLTYLARQGEFTPLVGYEACITHIFQILLRKGRAKYNPLLLDADEQRRRQIVVEVARRIAIGEAPDSLSTWQMIALNEDALFADIPASREDLPSTTSQRPLREEHTQGMALASPSSGPDPAWIPAQLLLEKRKISKSSLSRLQALLLAMRQAQGQVLLFVDHFHRLLNGEPERYPIDAATLLVPALARREIQFIGACTLAQHRRYSERDAGMLCRLEEVCVRPDDELRQT